MMGIGTAAGENRALEAAKMAISSPLMEESIEGATGMLLNFTGSEDLNLYEVNEAANIAVEHADKDANIIFGTVIDPTMGDEVRVTVIATGFEGFETLARKPMQVRERSRRRSVNPLGDRERRALRVTDDDIDVPDFLQVGLASLGPVAELKTNPPLRRACRRRGASWSTSPAGRCRCSTRACGAEHLAVRNGLRRLRRLAHGRDRDLGPAARSSSCSGCSPTTSRSSRSAAPSTRSSAARTAASSTTSSPTGSATTAT